MPDRVFAHLESLRHLGLMPSAATIAFLHTNFTGDRHMLDEALHAIQDASQTQPLSIPVRVHAGGGLSEEISRSDDTA